MRTLLLASLIVLASACNPPATPPASTPEPPAMATAEPIPPVGAKLELSDEQWRRRLSKHQYEILRDHGTEWAGSGSLLKNKADGVYVCAGCGAPLFDAKTKFESGTGWPSFYEPIEGRIGRTEDRSGGMTRIEVHCDRCGGHQGHVFRDGPKPTGLRYCINSLSLEFVPREQWTRREQLPAGK